MLPCPFGFVLYQLPELASFLFHKMPANLLHICTIDTNKFSSVMAIKAAEGTVCSFPITQRSKNGIGHRDVKLHKYPQTKGDHID